MPVQATTQGNHITTLLLSALHLISISNYPGIFALGTAIHDASYFVSSMRNISWHYAASKSVTANLILDKYLSWHAMKRMSDEQKALALWMHLAAQRDEKRQGRGLVCSPLDSTQFFYKHRGCKPNKLIQGGSVWTVLAQQIQLHKHASKNPAISAEPLMWVLIMQRSVRKRDAVEV